MRYLALCCDYDGTLAHEGVIDEKTVAALERVLASGRMLVMVTGRELDELKTVCPCLDLFERVVAENGALLYRPKTREEKVLAEAPPALFAETLRQRGVAPISVGRVIVATWEPHEQTVLETIRDLGLELQVIFNKGAVMVLPAGVNKASGLKAALLEMGLSPHNAIGVGDAENDHAFLNICECAVAVGNALPTLKDAADIVTTAHRGAGVAELIDELLENDLSRYGQSQRRHLIPIGDKEEDGSVVMLPTYGENLLIVGTSGGGKSTAATAFLENLHEQDYSFCIIDPEGDYEGLPIAATLGSGDRPPTADECMQLLQQVGTNIVLNLVGLAISERPTFFASLLPRIQELRTRTGHPHWLIVDEAHHMVPASWEPVAQAFPERMTGIMLITVHANLVAPAALNAVDTLLALGSHPAEMVRELSSVLGETPPALNEGALPPGHALLWRKRIGAAPCVVRLHPSRIQRRRHVRKYAEGELPPERSFYFRGPENALNLRAQNLIFFVQLAEGVDDATWLHHLRRHDFSRWISECIKDEELASEVSRVETDDTDPQSSRKQVRASIEARYTAPATPRIPIAGTANAPDG
jgi:HAD superfamily hydrolase (TIGR01484 family)